jgi:ABC-type molybdate transport system permease subunit
LNLPTANSFGGFLGKILKKLFLSLSLLFLSLAVAAADSLSEVLRLNAAINALEKEMIQIDAELRRCARARGDWRTATIIGGIGVVGTATGAIIQGVQINRAKKETRDKRQETSEK